MKFKKISETRLKITIPSHELTSFHTLDEFMLDSSHAKDSFFRILEQANSEVGFNTENYKIRVNAKSLYNGDIIFLVTKLVKLRNGNLSVRPRKIEKITSHSKSNYSIYRFDSFDDFCELSYFFKAYKINSLNTLADSCILYKYNMSYYLALKNINPTYKNLSKFYTLITEFSKYCYEDNTFAAMLSEKAEILLKNNAIVLCQNFINK